MERIEPRRRYALFTDIIYGDYMILVKGGDIKTAPKWGGFISWVGGVKCQPCTILEKKGEFHGNG